MRSEPASVVRSLILSHSLHHESKEHKFRERSDLDGQIFIRRRQRDFVLSEIVQLACLSTHISSPLTSLVCGDSETQGRSEVVTRVKYGGPASLARRLIIRNTSDRLPEAG